MRERTSQILESIIQEFIKTGEPISSERLFDRYDFGIKPAMIRSELGELTRLGFLEQPHHSAGRIPSNKGYEFYVNIIWDALEPEEPNREFIDFFKHRDLQDLVQGISDELKVLGVLSPESKKDQRTVYKEGLDNLFSNLKWESDSEVRQVIKDFEELDEKVGKAEDFFGEDFLEVFIGSKSPVTRSDNLAVIAGDYFLDGERMFLFAIGPKCMDYEKPLKVFKGLKEIN